MHHQYNPHHEMHYDQGYNMDNNPHKKQMYETCKNYYLYFVQIQTMDGQTYEGIIEDVDKDSVTLLMPYGDMEREEEIERQYGFGYGGFGYPRRFRRFRRFRFPFFGLSRLFFPYFY
ncbi:hypothetical protein [Virgibacillus salexigens]|uniref:hypothetical protein n=1 Tax=Virgibacillus salexigens TaxID=61016 RepID=UPI00190B9570|nr:hypothetical protein [Virgibacillus salexigens]